MADDTYFRAGFPQPHNARYVLVMSNEQAGEETSHRTMTRVRHQIRTWDACRMTCSVRDTKTGKTIYEGRALGF